MLLEEFSALKCVHSKFLINTFLKLLFQTRSPTLISESRSKDFSNPISRQFTILFCVQRKSKNLQSSLLLKFRSD